MAGLAEGAPVGVAGLLDDAADAADDDGVGVGALERLRGERAGYTVLIVL